MTHPFVIDLDPNVYQVRHLQALVALVDEFPGQELVILRVGNRTLILGSRVEPSALFYAAVANILGDVDAGRRWARA